MAASIALAGSHVALHKKKPHPGMRFDFFTILRAQYAPGGGP